MVTPFTLKQTKQTPDNSLILTNDPLAYGFYNNGRICVYIVKMKPAMSGSTAITTQKLQTHYFLLLQNLTENHKIYCVLCSGVGEVTVNNL